MAALFISLANTHEHLNADHHFVIKDDHKEVLFDLIENACEQFVFLLNNKGKLPMLQLVNPLSALGKMRIYNKSMFSSVSGAIANVIERIRCKLFLRDK